MHNITVKLTLVTLLLFGVVANAQTSVSTKAILQDVTVYKQGAAMHHTAQANLPIGSSELIINNVASNISENSIQISAPSSVTILSVTTSMNYLGSNNNYSKSPEYIKRENLLKDAQSKLALINNKKESTQATLNMLMKNDEIKGDNVGVSVAELSKMSDFYLQKQITLRQQITTLNQEYIEQQKLVKQLELELGEVSDGNVNTGGQIVVQVMSANNTNATFNINYITPNANWQSAYELRADNTKDPLKILYKAKVSQNTGVDWHKVQLTLSSGNPTQGSEIPDLPTWFLNYYNPYIGYNYKGINQLPNVDNSRSFDAKTSDIQEVTVSGAPGSGKSVKIRGIGSATSENPLYIVDGNIFNGDISQINPDDIESVKVLKSVESSSLYGSKGANGAILITTKNKGVSQFTTVASTTTNIIYTIDVPYSISSNGKPHAVTLKEYKHPVNYKYYVIPKLDPEVFLVAELSDFEKLDLTPGEATIIFENMYVGKTFINPDHTEDTLLLSMGRDKRISAERKQIAEKSDIKFLGNNKIQTITYEIAIRNNKKESAEITVVDQYPVSTNTDIVVDLKESSKAEVDQEKGLLTWYLSLKPGESKKIRFTYTVKYPKNKSIQNL